ncbi:MAG: helix-turn-helix domain-containing protein [Caulobacterales bacterium]
MAGDPNTLELLARGASVGVFMALAIGLSRGAPTPARITGVLVCLVSAARALAQFPLALSALGPVKYPVWALTIMGVGLHWAFATELFGDRRKLNPLRFAPALVLLAVGMAAASAPRDVSRLLWLTHHLIGIALIFHALAVIAVGWRQDLVEPRRTLRGPVLALGTIYALVFVSLDVFTTFRLSAPYYPSSLDALLSPLVGGLAIAVLLRADPALFEVARPADRAAPRPVAAQDQTVLTRLTRAMDEQELWRQDALTIADLARGVGVPEHRLRNAINTGLGYRNFAAFLNERRVAAAKAALADPAKTRTPVSAIAYEVGFGSLGPFNRAFKDATGMTPSAWRSASFEGDPKPAIPG